MNPHTCACSHTCTLKPHSYQFIYSHHMDSVKQALPTNAPVRLFENYLLSTCVCSLANMHVHPHADLSLAWGAKSVRPHPRQAPARSFPEQPVAGPASSDSTSDQWLPALQGHRLVLCQRIQGTPPTPLPQALILPWL